LPVHEALAQAFAAEGVDTHFTLMGDGNMHRAAAMKSFTGMSRSNHRNDQSLLHFVKQPTLRRPGRSVVTAKRTGDASFFVPSQNEG
jgi:hypothetical protein